MELHIGSEIAKVMKEKGITPEWLADQINVSRRNVYDIFDRAEVKTSQLAQISRALNYDFFSMYQEHELSIVNEPGLRPSEKKKRVMVSVELDGSATTLDYWFDVLKKFNAAM